MRKHAFSGQNTQHLQPNQPCGYRESEPQNPLAAQTTRQRTMYTGFEKQNLFMLNLVPGSFTGSNVVRKPAVVAEWSKTTVLQIQVAMSAA